MGANEERSGCPLNLSWTGHETCHSSAQTRSESMRPRIRQAAVTASSHTAGQQSIRAETWLWSTAAATRTCVAVDHVIVQFKGQKKTLLCRVRYNCRRGLIRNDLYLQCTWAFVHRSSFCRRITLWFWAAINHWARPLNKLP
jgi:hypothetical protein